MFIFKAFMFAVAAGAVGGLIKFVCDCRNFVRSRF